MREIKGKKITFLGAARSGIAAAKLAKRHGAIPFVSDAAPLREIGDKITELEKARIEFEIGIHSDRVFEADFIVTSPGVPDDSAPIKKAKSLGLEIISELEFASGFCKGKIIAITGTNGKTTTTTLCAYTLNNAGFKTYLAGNIGTAFSDVVDNVKENEFVALEVSSFQLDHIKEFKPYIAVILNITPDHLDRYENSFEKYIESKLRITENQNGNDYLIVNADDKNLTGISTGAQRYAFSISQVVERGAYFAKGALYFKDTEHPDKICNRSELSLKGEHNLANALAVLTVAKLLGVKNSSVCQSFSSFKGVEHRLEFVREIDGVKFVNDSKATNVDSVWYALRSFNEPLRLILGGKDKGNDYSAIDEPVKKHVKKIYAIGSSAEKVYGHFKELVPTEIKESLEDAVVSAFKEAEKGEVVLLSPACASFDMFDNYEHRGKVFKEIVRKL